MAFWNRNRLDRLPAPPGRALTAAATQIDIASPKDSAKVAKAHELWQDRAWEYYDEIPEIWFAHNYVANALRRIRVFPATLVDPQQPPVPLADVNPTLAARANAELARLYGEDGTIGEIIHDLALQLSIPGEGYLVGDIQNDIETIAVYSQAELWFKESKWYLREGPEDREGTQLSDSAFVNRIWRQHPKWRNRSDSGMRAVLDPCEELQIFSRYARATGRSRLNAGALFIPNEITFQNVEGQAAGMFGNATKIDPFLDQILTGMITPVQDEGTASAVVPMIFKVKSDLIEKIKHMTFDRPFDEVAAGRVDQLLKRVAAGLDLPAEVILGMADLNHWTAWQVDESTFKAHLEPLVALVVTGLTKAFLRPALADVAGGEDVLLWFDPSALVSNPNQVGVAGEALKSYAISWEAYRRTTGFSEEDAPSDEEILQRADISRLEKSKITTTTDDATPIVDPGAGPASPTPTAPGDSPSDPPSVQASAHNAGTARALELQKMEKELRLTLQAACESVVNAGKQHVSRVMAADTHQGEFVTDDRLEEAVGPIVATYNRLVSRAQAKVRDHLTELDPEFDPEDLETRQAEHRSAGLGVLRAGLVGVLGKALFNPTPAQERRGENVDTLVPAGIVRDALSVAGGGDVSSPASQDGQFDGGVFTGSDVRESMVESGFAATAFLWTYNYSGPSSFQSHADLDGLEFSGLDDDALTINDEDSWLGTERYFPGDHNGCQCDASEVWEPFTYSEETDR